MSDKERYLKRFETMNYHDIIFWWADLEKKIYLRYRQGIDLQSNDLKHLRFRANILREYIFNSHRKSQTDIILNK